MTGQHAADTQLGYLLRAAESAAAAAGPLMHRDGAAGELAAKADHLAACVYAVDAMCRGGDLPAAWRGSGGKNAATGGGAGRVPQPPRPRMRPSGTCSACGEMRAMRADGNVQNHRLWVFGSPSACSGSGRPPVEGDQDGTAAREAG